MTTLFRPPLYPQPTGGTPFYIGRGVSRVKEPPHISSTLACLLAPLFPHRGPKNQKETCDDYAPRYRNHKYYSFRGPKCLRAGPKRVTLNRGPKNRSINCQNGKIGIPVWSPPKKRMFREPPKYFQSPNGTEHAGLPLRNETTTWRISVPTNPERPELYCNVPS